MKKIFLTLFILTLSLIAIQAQTEKTGPYDVGECVTIKQTCSNCTYSNISSVISPSPNSSVVLANTIMTTANNIEYSYNCLTVSKRGEYIINGYSDIDGIRTVWAYNLEVGSNVWLWLILVSLAGFFLIMSVFGNTQFFLFISGSLFITSAVFSMINGISSLSETYTRIISFVVLGLGLLLILGAYLDFGGYGGREDDDED